MASAGIVGGSGRWRGAGVAGEKARWITATAARDRSAAREVSEVR